MRDITEIEMSPRLQIIQRGEDGMTGYIHHPRIKKPMTFVASWGGGWEHVSVSFGSRCPVWEEMCIAKNIFWKPDEMAVQYHPAEKDYVNMHPYCLHIWKPIGVEVPMPPPIFVGF